VVFGVAVALAVLCAAFTFYRAAAVYALGAVAFSPWPWPFGLERFRSGR
jgi:hypothetical protein